MQLQQTSLDARASLDDALPALELEVLSVIFARGPVSCQDVEVITGRPHTTISARITGLQKRGKVHDSGLRGKTPSGRSCILWTTVKPQPAP